MAKPIRRYFKYMGGLWYWQICYDDQINYASVGKNLIYQLWDYWLTCRAAKMEHKYKTIGREADKK